MITNQKTEHYESGYAYQANAPEDKDASGSPARTASPRDAKWPLGIRFLFILGLSGLLWTGIFMLIWLLFF